MTAPPRHTVQRVSLIFLTIMLILSAIPFVQSAAPTAGFSYSPLAPTTSDTVAFTDTSTDDWSNITNWTWDFGDGTFAYTQNPTHRYADDGVYTVTLNVTDNETFWDTHSEAITVANTPPVSSFTYAPGAPLTSETVAFTDTSSDADGTVTNWTWDFGDGNTSYAQHPSHGYPEDGTYTVNLTVRDDDGATHTSSQSVAVGNRAPTAAITSSGSFGDTRTTFTFTDASTDADGAIVNQTWTLGDGTSLFGSTIAHQYAANGTYNVTLTVRDDDGATGSTNATVTVNRTASGFIQLPPPQIAATLHEDALNRGRFLVHVPIGPDTHTVHVAAPASAHGLDGVDLAVSGAGTLELELRGADAPLIDGFAVGSAFDISLTLGGETEVLHRVLRLDPEAYPEGADPAQVVLLHDDGATWHAVPTTDGSAHPPSFSPFAIAIDTEAPSIMTGDGATFSATDNRGIALVALYIDGKAVDVVQEDGTYRPAEQPAPGAHEARAVVTDESGLVTEQRWVFGHAGDSPAPASAPSATGGPAPEDDTTGRAAETPAAGAALAVGVLTGLVLFLRRRTD